MKIVEIIITPDGEAQLQTKGFAGRTCTEASRFLETALGRNVSDKLTAEFFTVARAVQNEQLSSGSEGW